MTQVMKKDTTSAEDEFDKILADAGIEIDENSEEPVVFDYTDTEIKEMIVSARVRMLIKHPFFGTLATRLKLVEAEWLPTAATDGKHLYYNAQFFRTLTPGEIDFVIGHEVLHNVYSHCGEGSRLMDYDESNRDGKLWNIAADYKVNQGLVESRIGDLPKCALYDVKYQDSYTEEIYADLKEQQENGKDFSDEETLDEHMFGDGDGDGKGNDPTGRNGPIKISKAEAQAIKDQMKQAVVQAAQNAGSGNLPGGVARIVKNLTEPKMDWRELLNLSMQSCLKSDFTWMRQSRKSRSMGIYLPGQDPDEVVDVCIGLDVSGSISHEMLQDFMSEVAGIMTQFQDFRLRVWTFDTKVYEESFKEFTPMNAEEINEYNIIGCGGTDFMCNWNFMEDNDIQPDKFIMFTDGMPWDKWGDENYCDTLFVIHGSDSITPPFGEFAYYSK